VRRQVIASTLGVALLLSACGGGDDSGDDSGAGGDAGGDTTTTNTTAAADAAAGATTTVAEGASTTTTAAPVDDDAVPDPCTLIPGPALAMILAGDQGAGESSAYDPEQRRICSYASGVILAVELADHYDAAIDIIRDETGDDSVQEVSGVGNAAVWQDLGAGMGQFIAQGDEYFVGVTLPAGGQDVGQVVAEAMLGAL
jgi:hypothetical protein